MDLGIEVCTFKKIVDGETLFCCVSKDDYSKFGEQCLTDHQIVKGVSDNKSEAIQDYQFNFILAADVGLESDEQHAH